MAFNANAFRAQLEHGGARSNLFEVELTFPGFINGNEASEKSIFMCKASQLPGMTLANIEVPYFGRKIKVAGDRNFEDWSVTVINDEDFAVRNALEAWSNEISQINHDTNTARTPQTIGVNTYVADISIKQYGKDGTVIKSYKMANSFPLAIDPIDVSWDSENTIEEFGVTFSYDYFTTSEIN